MISKYYEFLLESQIYNLILEGNMIFSTDFLDILDTLSTNSDNHIRGLATVIRDYSGKDVNIDTNCIDISDNATMLSFIPDDKIVKSELVYRILRRCDVLTYNPSSPHPLFDQLNVPGEGLINLHPRELIYDTWKLIKKQNAVGYNYDFYYLQDSNNPNRFIVVYVVAGVEAIVPDKSTSNRKSDIKLGRFVNKLLQATGQLQFSAAMIEKFVNQFQAEVLIRKDTFKHFRIVEGEDIVYWYNESNYEARTGQLANSCMRYDNCKNFFRIYTENPDVCKLVIFTPNDPNKIAGRALLWTLEDGTKYMDRIYTNKDSYDALFIKWGSDNGYQKSIPPRSKVKVKEVDYMEYPYMDTFQYYSAELGTLSNSNIFSRPYALLDETDGEADWKY